MATVSWENPLVQEGNRSQVVKELISDLIYPPGPLWTGRHLLFILKWRLDLNVCALIFTRPTPGIERWTPLAPLTVIFFFESELNQILLARQSAGDNVWALAFYLAYLQGCRHTTQSYWAEADDLIVSDQIVWRVNQLVHAPMSKVCIWSHKWSHRCRPAASRTAVSSRRPSTFSHGPPLGGLICLMGGRASLIEEEGTAWADQKLVLSETAAQRNIHLQMSRGLKNAGGLVALPRMLVTHRKATWRVLCSSSLCSRAHQHWECWEEYEQGICSLVSLREQRKRGKYKNKLGCTEKLIRRKNIQKAVRHI